MSKFFRSLSSRSKEELTDKLHRGFVDLCLGMTMVSGVMMCYKTYEYLRYIRPIQKAIQAQAEKELLSVGEAMELPVTEEFND